MDPFFPLFLISQIQLSFAFSKSESENYPDLMKELYLWGLLIHLFSCHFILGIFNVFLGFSVFPMWILFCLVGLPIFGTS